jgi:hypothetical protein
LTVLFNIKIIKKKKQQQATEKRTVPIHTIDHEENKGIVECQCN